MDRKTILFTALLLICIAATCLVRTVEDVTTNEGSRLALVESLVHYGQSNIEQSVFFDTVDKVEHEGKFYSDKTPGLALYSASWIYPLRRWVDFGSPRGFKILYTLIVLTSSGVALCFLIYYYSGILSFYGRGRALGGWCCFLLLICSSASFPFFFTYNTHVVEAACAAGVLYHLCRYNSGEAPRHLFWAGILLGISANAHPISAVVFGCTAAVYLLRRNPRHLVRLLAPLLLFASLFCFSNYQVSGNIIPHYVKGEGYLYLDNGEPNEWIHNPELLQVAGLTRDKLKKRLEVLAVPEETAEESLSRFNEATKRGPAAARVTNFVRNFIRYDWLTFSPLILFGLVSFFVRSKETPHRFKDPLRWAVLSALVLYALHIAIMSQPGWSFGNRYLIPALALMILSVLLPGEAEGGEKFSLILLAVTAPFMIANFNNPWGLSVDSLYWRLNATLFLVADFFVVLFWVSKSFRARFLSVTSTEIASESRLFLLVGGGCLLQILMRLLTNQ